MEETISLDLTNALIGEVVSELAALNTRTDLLLDKTDELLGNLAVLNSWTVIAVGAMIACTLCVILAVMYRW